MSRLRLLPLLALGLIACTIGFAQEKKEPPKEAKESKDSKTVKEVDPKAKEPMGKLKGFLPQNWGKIGLSEDQKQAVYKVQNIYRDEIDRLNARIDDLKAQQKKDLEKILTDEQKKRLREILTGEKEK